MGRRKAPARCTPGAGDWPKQPTRTRERQPQSPRNTSGQSTTPGSSETHTNPEAPGGGSQRGPAQTGPRGASAEQSGEATRRPRPRGAGDWPKQPPRHRERARRATWRGRTRSSHEGRRGLAPAAHARPRVTCPHITRKYHAQAVRRRRKTASPNGGNAKGRTKAAPMACKRHIHPRPGRRGCRPEGPRQTTNGPSNTKHAQINKAPAPTSARSRAMKRGARGHWQGAWENARPGESPRPEGSANHRGDAAPAPPKGRRRSGAARKCERPKGRPHHREGGAGGHRPSPHKGEAPNTRARRGRQAKWIATEPGGRRTPLGGKSPRRAGAGPTGPRSARRSTGHPAHGHGLGHRWPKAARSNPERC